MLSSGLRGNDTNIYKATKLHGALTTVNIMIKETKGNTAAWMYSFSMLASQSGSLQFSADSAIAPNIFNKGCVLNSVAIFKTVTGKRINIKVRVETVAALNLTA